MNTLKINIPDERKGWIIILFNQKENFDPDKMYVPDENNVIQCPIALREEDYLLEIYIGGVNKSDEVKFKALSNSFDSNGIAKRSVHFYIPTDDELNAKIDFSDNNVYKKYFLDFQSLEEKVFREYKY